MISKGAKKVNAWQTCGFFNGDNTWLYVYIPGLFVGSNGEKLNLTAPVTGSIRIFAFTKNVNIYVPLSELYDIIQYNCGVVISFKHSGIGYGGSCQTCTELIISA